MLSNLKAGTYRVEELAKDGYENVSITGPIAISAKGTYTFAVVNRKLAEPPPVTAFHYLALGDSIATGKSSKGTTTSYVTTFYNHLKTIYPDATMRNLAVDGDDASELLARLSGSTYIEELNSLMTKVTRFLGTEHTYRLIYLPAEVSLVYQAIPAIPAVPVCFCIVKTPE
ncbi:hypothetical protein [Youngiibacter multivorans]|nr:hypothetical protein [Youngiibacter multivorans]